MSRLDVHAVLGEGGLFAEAFPGYEARPAQLAMAELVAASLRHDGVALIEAGTGTGKTFAYLVPALLSGKRVVLSTGTRALQDQLAQRDVPMLEKVLAGSGLFAELARIEGTASAASESGKLPVAVLKGLSNYVCLRRYEELLASAESVSRPEIVRHLPVVQSFVQEASAGRVVGERGELPEVPDDAPIWSSIESGSDTRLGARCRFHDRCFVTRAREVAEKARVVVVNHHLFFADLALRARGASVLPAYDAVVFDEAHQLPDVLTQFFGIAISASRLDRLVRDVDRTLAALRVDSEISERLLRMVLVRASDLFDAVAHLGEGRDERARGEREGWSGESRVERVSTPPSGSSPPSSGRGRARRDGRQPLTDEDREELRDYLFDLEAALEAASAHVRGTVDEDEKNHDALTQCARRLDDVRNDLLVLVEGGHGLVVWLETRGRYATLGASPVEVGRFFRDQVLRKTPAVVLTSATLSTDGHFAHTRRELGIHGEIDELVLPSPFDYPSQAALYLPDLPDPRDPSFAAKAVDEVRALVLAAEGGAFVLTTSVRMQDELARALGPSLRARGYEVLVQGQRPKHLLLERFREHGDAVLFATLGFWEGVDVPGHALRLVVLDKVPFEVPSDPLVKARCERIEAEEGSAFRDYLLPSAALTLKQGFGRLVRTREDRGLVAILDGRLRKMGYGKVLLRSLPEARRLERREDAEAFLRGVRAAAKARDEAVTEG